MIHKTYDRAIYLKMNNYLYLDAKQEINKYCSRK